MEVVGLGHRYSDFTAMFYTWGDPKAERLDIFVEDSNGGLASFEVLQNLYQLLLHLRHPKNVQRLQKHSTCDKIREEALYPLGIKCNMAMKIMKNKSKSKDEEDNFQYQILSQQGGAVLPTSGVPWHLPAFYITYPALLPSLELRTHITSRNKMAAPNSDDAGVATVPQPEQRPTKRRRTIYVCDLCRVKKNRCDGERPACGACLKRQVECLYAGQKSHASDTQRLDLTECSIYRQLY